MLAQNLVAALPDCAPQCSRVPAVRFDLFFEEPLYAGGMLGRAAGFERAAYLCGDCGWGALRVRHDDCSTQDCVAGSAAAPAVLTNTSYTHSAAAVASPMPVIQNQIIAGWCRTSPK